MIEPKEQDAGRRVIYRAWLGAAPEHGVVRAWSDAFVFVVYDGDKHAKATRRENLEWAAGSVRQRET